ncbi:MAG: DinB family protein [Flavobacteriales bacterium]|nr:DinB family protein [Flavobacteriales bacterium]
MITIERPKPGDFPPYFGAYVHAARGEQLDDALDMAAHEEARVFALVPPNKWEHRYAPDKWSIKEVFQHIIDTERVFTYRALCIARNEQANLPGMDENAYQAEARTALRQPADILRELKAVRQATIELFKGLDADAVARGGTANGKHITVRALGWVIAGHSEHHLRIIRERYLA